MFCQADLPVLVYIDATAAWAMSGDKSPIRSYSPPEGAVMESRPTEAGVAALRVAGAFEAERRRRWC